MRLPRHGLILAFLVFASPAAADVAANPGVFDVQVTPGDDAALKADAGLRAPIPAIDTGLHLTLESDPSVINDPLAATASANATRERLGFDAAWSSMQRARIDLSLDEALAQTWTPLTLFTTANHEVDTDQTSAKLDLILSPSGAVDVSLTGDAQRSVVRDWVSDAFYAPAPSLFTTEIQGATAGLKWRPTSWLSFDARGRMQTTDALWQGAGGAGLAEARLDYADLEPSVTGALNLPWNDKLALSFEHAVSPLDAHAFASFAAVPDRDPDVRFGPQREWRYRLTFDQTWAGALQVNAALVEAQIEDASELGPAGDGQEAPVNVSGGDRQEADLSLKAPLTVLGLPGLTLNGQGAWRDSQIRDPFTGQLRRASAEVPQAATLGLEQSSADHRTRWGIEGHFGGGQTLYQMSQVTQVRVSDSVGGYIEYAPGSFAFRLQVDGLYGGDRNATDIVYAQPRGSIPDDPVDHVDTHTDGGQAVRLILRRSL